MKKRRWSCSGSLPILHIDESESKVDIYLNKQFTYPSLFFLCLHNSIFSPLFFAFFRQNLNILSTKPTPPNLYCSPSLPSSSSYPSYSSYFSSSCYPSSSSSLPREDTEAFYWKYNPTQGCFLRGQLIRLNPI